MVDIDEESQFGTGILTLGACARDDLEKKLTEWLTETGREAWREREGKRAHGKALTSGPG
jgi:hypothetical protein